MSHESKRIERVEVVMKITKAMQPVRVQILAAQVSLQTGCSLAKANEYIATLTLTERLRVIDGIADLFTKELPQPSA